MKKTPLLILTAALAFGTSFASAQEEAKPQTPPPAETPAPPPKPAAPTPPRPPEREKMRGDKDRRDHREGRPGDGRPGERERQDGPRGEKRGEKDRGDKDRHDGPDQPGDRHRGPGPDRQRHMPGPDRIPQKPASYIGVVTVPPPEVIGAQFALAPGFGLIVVEVLPDSPAALAGLQKFDILTKFNDQQLVDGGQFSTLVRAQAKDSDATLTLFRKAQEQKVTVKIGERMMPERRSFPHMGAMPHGMNPGHGMPPGHGMNPGNDMAMEHMKRMQEQAREMGERMRDAQKQGNAPVLEQMKKMQERLQKQMREMQERMKDQMQKSAPEDSKPQADASDALQMNSGDLLREVQPGGSATVTLLQPNAAVTYLTGEAKVMMKDDDGEFEISTTEGHRNIIAKNAEGVTTFEGSIDTDQQREALPEDIRKKLEIIEDQAKIVRFDAPVFSATDADDDVQ